MDTKLWLRRLGYVLIILVWLVVITFPFFAVFLASQGEVRLGEDPQRHVRIFLIQERDLQGVGIERARPLRDTTSCFQTRLSYLMWEGEGENVSFCQCMDPANGAITPAPPGVCP